MLACLLMMLSGTARAELALGDLLVVDRPFRLDSEELAIEIDRGVLVTVVDEVGPVGMVCVCTVAAAITPSTERQRIALAARQASPRPEGEEPDALEVEGLVMFGTDVARELAPRGTPVRASGQVFVRSGSDIVAEEIVVVDARASRVLTQARRMLRKVVRDLQDAGMHPTEIVDLDRAEPPDSTATPHRVTAVVAPGWRIDGRLHPGLLRLRDPAGTLGWHASRVVMPGFSWTGEPLATGGELERRVDLLGVGLIARFEVVPPGLSSTLVAAAELRVRAVDGPTSTLVFDFPHVEGGFWQTTPPEPDAWGIVSLTVDDEPVDWHVVDEGHRERHEGAWRRVHVTLPEPLEEGEVLELSAKWADRQRYTYRLELVGSGGAVNYRLYGLATNVTRLLPRTPSHGGDPVAVRYTVGAIGGVEQDQVMVSAKPERTWIDAESEARWASGKTRGGLAAAAGRWSTESVPGSPSIRMARQRVGAPMLEVDQLRVALAYLGQVLPGLPHRDVAAVQLWQDPDANTAQVHHGLVGYTLLRPVTGTAGGPPAWLLARGLAPLWWHGEPPTRDERTLSEAAGVAYGVWLAQAAGRRAGRDAEELFFAPTDDLFPRISPRDPVVGGFLLARTLSARFGDDVVRQALYDTLAADGPADWSALEQHLSEATGEDLEGVSVPWVEGGLLPSVAVTWRTGDRSVALEVTTNVPGGRIDVPVQVQRRGKKVTEVVVVRDGRGSAEVRWRGKPPAAVSIDPDDELLLGRTRVQRDDP